MANYKTAKLRKLFAGVKWKIGIQDKVAYG